MGGNRQQGNGNRQQVKGNNKPDSSGLKMAACAVLYFTTMDGDKKTWYSKDVQPQFKKYAGVFEFWKNRFVGFMDRSVNISEYVIYHVENGSRIGDPVVKKRKLVNGDWEDLLMH